MTGNAQKFAPGFYRMRNGERAEVFAERDGRLLGRILATRVALSWELSGHYVDTLQSECDLLSPWTEERKTFECWVNRYNVKYGIVFWPTEEMADEHAARDRIGPAIRMIEATSLTEAAGDLYEALDQCEACLSIVEPRSDKAEYRRIHGVVRAALAKAGKP